MSTVLPFQNEGVFDQNAIGVMSAALDEICRTMNLRPNADGAREVIALRIVELALHGETSAEQIQKRILRGWRSPQAGSLDPADGQVTH